MKDKKEIKEEIEKFKKLTPVHNNAKFFNKGVVAALHWVLEEIMEGE